MALAAAACGGAETPAPEPAATTAAPATTAAAPTTAAPAPATTLTLAEECAAEGADLAEDAAVEARELMDAGPAGLGLQRLEELREAARLDVMALGLGCEGGWTADDEVRYRAILAAPAADEPVAETGDATGAEPEGEAPDNGPAAEQSTAPAPTTEPAGPAPDDPEWVDELPEPADPDPAPVGAVLDWDKGKLRPVAEVRPDVCEHMPQNCGASGRWTWGPMAVTIGTRAVAPAAVGETRINSTGRIRSTPCGQRYSYTVTGFAAEDVGVGGLRSVRVLLTQHAEATSSLWEQVESDPIDPLVGCVEALDCPPPDGAVRCLYRTEGTYNDTSILAVVLTEHADTITCGDGQPAPAETDPCPTAMMTGATLLLFSPPPRADG